MSETVMLIISVAAGAGVAGLLAWKLKKSCVP